MPSNLKLTGWVAIGAYCLVLVLTAAYFAVVTFSWAALNATEPSWVEPFGSVIALVASLTGETQAICLAIWTAIVGLSGNVISAPTVDNRVKNVLVVVSAVSALVILICIILIKPKFQFVGVSPDQLKLVGSAIVSSVGIVFATVFDPIRKLTVK